VECLLLFACCIAPTRAGEPATSPVRAKDGFEYETAEDLKAVWQIQGSGFAGPIEARLSTSEAREGKKCLEVILPPTKGPENARLILDVYPKVALKDVKQIRFWMFVERTKGISQSAVYCIEKDLKSFFCGYGFHQKLHDGWQMVYISKTGLTRKEGAPSWEDITRMRLSLWFPANEPATRILLDEMVWDSEAERPMNLNKEWYN
jgi:hypothetical protein